CKSFSRDPDDVVVNLLGSERLARCLHVEAEVHRLWVFGSEAFLHYLGIYAPCSPEFRDFLKELHCTAEKERKTWCKVVHLHTPCSAGLYILNRVCERERQLLHCVTASFPHVVARDANRVPLWHLL